MSRPTRAIIDLKALQTNYRKARALHGGRALAVLKANAYGHGAISCANALASLADGFAVAFLDEALQLRQAGIRNPILILEGCFSRAELLEAQRSNCWIVVHHESQLRAIEQLNGGGRPLDVWLKIDTGMRRAGFPTKHAVDAYRRLRACANVSQVTLMSHFARADEPDSLSTQEQVHQFDAAVAGIDAPQSLSNSAGLLLWPHARREWARPGIVLYGTNSIPGTAESFDPVMTLESEVIAVRDLQAGDALGYGAHFVADTSRRIGLVAIGYADGYPRTTPNGTPVQVDGRQAAVLGRVSMDMMTIDLTDAPAAGVGSRVELWGKTIPVSTIASSVGTLDYELLCHVQRVERSYVAGTR